MCKLFINAALNSFLENFPRKTWGFNEKSYNIKTTKALHRKLSLSQCFSTEVIKDETSRVCRSLRIWITIIQPICKFSWNSCGEFINVFFVRLRIYFGIFQLWQTRKINYHLNENFNRISIKNPFNNLLHWLSHFRLMINLYWHDFIMQIVVLQPLPMS